MSIYMEIHQTLKGSRMMKDGRLTVPGLSEKDYEAIYEYIVEQLPPPNVRDYFGFLHRQALRYFRYRRQRNYKPGTDVDPLCMLAPDELDTKQQLSILKWYVSKLAYKKPHELRRLEDGTF